jgi:hypothetical protein
MTTFDKLEVINLSLLRRFRKNSTGGRSYRAHQHCGSASRLLSSPKLRIAVQHAPSQATMKSVILMEQCIRSMDWDDGKAEDLTLHAVQTAKHQPLPVNEANFSLANDVG